MIFVACCFFGHHDAPENIKEMIAEHVKEEIQNGCRVIKEKEAKMQQKKHHSKNQ